MSRYYFSYQCTYVFPWAKQKKARKLATIASTETRAETRHIVTDSVIIAGHGSPMMSRPVWPSQLYNDLPGCLYAMKSTIAPHKIEITLNHRRNTALKDFIIVVQPGSDRIKHMQLQNENFKTSCPK